MTDQLDFATPNELAREWRVTPYHVRALVRSGQLFAYRIGAAYRIPRTSASDYLKSRATRQQSRVA